MDCEDCRRFDEDLIPYVLGLVDDEARARLDEHMVGCATCLRAFLETKRHVERAGGSPRPSPAAKERLRQALFDRPAASRPARVWRSLARPVPLYQAFGAVLAVAALAALVPRFVEIGAARTRAHVRVDTSRQVPESVGIY
jgi:anti-sigma factor RsiW